MLFALPHADTEEGQNNGGQTPPPSRPRILHYSVVSSASASLSREKVKLGGNSLPESTDTPSPPPPPTEWLRRRRERSGGSWAGLWLLEQRPLLERTLALSDVSVMSWLQNSSFKGASFPDSPVFWTSCENQPSISSLLVLLSQLQPTV